MCGIVGFVGKQECSGILLEGLRRLEYRGYDSAGLAVYDGQRTNLLRVEGKLAGLEKVLREKPLPGSIGIGHTRWATHGRPSEENAHPHKAGPVVVVHNGIIENHMHLKREFLEAGVVFHSETDTEIISHLVFREIAAGADLEAAVRAALKRIEGSYAIAVSSETEPDKIVAARFASPLVIGLGEGENFVASDIPAILAHTRNVLFLEDGEMAVISGDSVRISTIDGKTVSREPRRIEWSATMAERGGYKHFMLKEIHEQPRAITDTLRGRISLERGEVILDGATPDREMLAALKRIVIVACGTAGMRRWWGGSGLKISADFR
jgi:glucosamine--fructose-6-phosphate aminotransferase (isomerizing)